MMSLLENKKSHFLFWILMLIFIIWGFYNPQEFMGKKWDYVTTKEGQFSILFVMLGITIARLIQLYLAIKKDKE